MRDDFDGRRLSERRDPTVGHDLDLDWRQLAKSITRPLQTLIPPRRQCYLPLIKVGLNVIALA